MLIARTPPPPPLPRQTHPLTRPATPTHLRNTPCPPAPHPRPPLLGRSTTHLTATVRRTLLARATLPTAVLVLVRRLLSANRPHPTLPSVHCPGSLRPRWPNNLPRPRMRPTLASTDTRWPSHREDRPGTTPPKRTPTRRRPPTHPHTQRMDTERGQSPHFPSFFTALVCSGCVAQGHRLWLSPRSEGVLGWLELTSKLSSHPLPSPPVSLASASSL